MGVEVKDKTRRVYNINLEGKCFDEKGTVLMFLAGPVLNGTLGHYHRLHFTDGEAEARREEAQLL